MTNFSQLPVAAGALSRALQPGRVPHPHDVEWELVRDEPSAPSPPIVVLTILGALSLFGLGPLLLWVFSLSVQACLATWLASSPVLPLPCASAVLRGPGRLDCPRELCLEGRRTWSSPLRRSQSRTASMWSCETHWGFFLGLSATAGLPKVKQDSTAWLPART